MTKKKGIYFLMVLGGMFLASLALLFQLSLWIWKADGGLGVLSGGVIAIYIIVNLVGGFLIGKSMGKQKFFWGMVVGGVYFSILLLAGICLVDTKLAANTQLWNGAMLCIVAGTAGGMFAPGRKEA